MGFFACTTAPTALRFLRVVITWVTARASALSAFLGAAHSRLLELLTELPKDGSALRELEEKMHREIGRCLDIVTAAVLRAAHSSPEVLSQVELLVKCQKISLEARSTPCEFSGRHGRGQVKDSSRLASICSARLWCASSSE